MTVELSPETKEAPAPLPEEFISIPEAFALPSAVELWLPPAASTSLNALAVTFASVPTVISMLA